MADDNVPKDASSKSKAEGDRWGSDSETVERYDSQRSGPTGDNAGGITNRPLDEEVDNQAALPDRGESREGANAGHGHAIPDDQRSER